MHAMSFSWNGWLKQRDTAPGDALVEWLQDTFKCNAAWMPIGCSAKDRRSIREPRAREVVPREPSNTNVQLEPPKLMEADTQTGSSFSSAPCPRSNRWMMASTSTAVGTSKKIEVNVEVRKPMATSPSTGTQGMNTVLCGQGHLTVPRMPSRTQGSFVMDRAPGYKQGDKVFVWNDAKMSWQEGRIAEVFPERRICDGFLVPAGALKVSTVSGPKWVNPEHVASCLRRNDASF